MFPLEIDEFQSPTVNLPKGNLEKQSIRNLVRITIVGTINLCLKKWFLINVKQWLETVVVMIDNQVKYELKDGNHGG